MKEPEVLQTKQKFFTILVCITLFVLFVISYFFFNSGEKGLDLAIFGYLMVLPSGVISVFALSFFRFIRKIEFESLGRKRLALVIMGNCLLIFPMTPAVMFELHNSSSAFGVIAPFVFQVLTPFLYYKMITLVLPPRVLRPDD